MSLASTNASQTTSVSQNPDKTKILNAKYDCFFCCCKFVSVKVNFTENCLMVCNDCMGNKDKIRDAILSYDRMTENLKLITDRVCSLESKLVTPLELEQKSVSEMIKLNSDKIKMLSEKQDYSDRKMNIIINGLDASMGNGLSYVVSEIFSFLGLNSNTWQANRVNHTNLVRVVFASTPERLYILKNSNKLRFERAYAKIYLNPDYSYDYEQRQKNKKLRENLKNVQISKPKAFIKSGSIVYIDDHGVVVPIEEIHQNEPIPSSSSSNYTNTPMSSQHIVDRRRRGHSTYSS